MPNEMPPKKKRKDDNSLEGRGEQSGDKLALTLLNEVRKLRSEINARREIGESSAASGRQQEEAVEGEEEEEGESEPMMQGSTSSFHTAIAGNDEEDLDKVEKQRSEREMAKMNIMEKVGFNGVTGI